VPREIEAKAKPLVFMAGAPTEQNVLYRASNEGQTRVRKAMWGGGMQQGDL